MGQLSTECGILNVSQSYGPPWPPAGLALLLLSACFLDLHLEDGVQTLHLQHVKAESEKKRAQYLGKTNTNYSAQALNSNAVEITTQRHKCIISLNGDMDVRNVLSSFCSITLVSSQT
jgi:hypothetical protein